MRVTSFSSVSRPLPFVGSTSLQPASAPLPPSILQRQGLTIYQAQDLIALIEQNIEDLSSIIMPENQGILQKLNPWRAHNRFYLKSVLQHQDSMDLLNDWNETKKALESAIDLANGSFNIDFNGYLINLPLMNLKRFNFDRCDLTYANFCGALLNNASFREANLEGTFFGLASLNRADFTDAKIKNYDSPNPTIFYSALIKKALGLPMNIDNSEHSITNWQNRRKKQISSVNRGS